MKMKNLVAFAMLALGAVVSPFAAMAHSGDAKGDIYSIDLVSDYGGFIPTKENPAKPNHMLVIRVRLGNPDCSVTGGGESWKFYPTTPGMEQFFPPKLGIKLGDNDGEAEYLDTKAVSTTAGYVTDIYFGYTVKSGDLAWPALLMGSDMKAATTGASYYIYNSMYWDLKSTWTSAPETQVAVTGNWTYRYPWYIKGVGDQNYTPSGDALGMYVKTVDFDGDYAVYPDPLVPGDEGIWRKVQRGLPATTTIPPSIVPDVKAETSATMYIWTEDEDIAVPYGNNVRDIDLLDMAGNPTGKKRRVLTISVAPSDARKEFALYGLANGPTRVCLGSTPNNVWSGGGDLITNWVSHVINVVDPDDPTLRIQFDGAGSPLKVTPTFDYKTSVGGIRLTISPAVDHPVTVNLAAALAGTGDLDDIFAKNLIGLSEAGNWYGKDKTVTIPAGGEKTLKLFAFGYTSKTVDTAIENGIDFTASCTDPAVKVDSTAKLKLYLEKSTIEVKDVQHDEAIVPGSKATFRMRLDDCYMNLHSADGYTVKWELDGDALEDSEDITWDEDDEEGVFVMYKKINGAEGEHEVKIVVIAPDGKTKSAPYKFKINLATKKKVVAVLDDGTSNGTCGESDKTTVPVSIKLQGGTYSDNDAYAFLVPKNAATSNAVDLTVTGIKTGMRVPEAEKEGEYPVKMKFLDGDAFCEFEVVLSKKSTKIDEITSFSRGTFTMTVSNLVAQVKNVSVGGTTVTKDGETLKKDLAVGVAKSFSVAVQNEVDADLKATGDKKFKTRWTFNGGTPQIMEGNPNENGKAQSWTPNATGLLPVTVEFQDKDMNGEWSEPFTFYVNVLAAPAIEILPTFGETYLEDQSGAQKSPFTVKLNIPPDFDSGEKKLRVKLWATKRDHVTPVDPKSLKLSVDYVDFTSGASTQTFFLETLDGTKESETGYEIHAEVDESGSDSDADGKKWKSFVQPVYIINNNPVIRSPKESLDKDGKPTATQKEVGTVITLDYAVTDIDADLGSELEVKFTTSEGESKTYHTATGTHSFSFKDSGQNKYVTMDVKDKDGGTASLTLYYNISAAKRLTTHVSGPSGGIADSALSQHYQGATGLGAGHVWVEDAAFSGASMFGLNWNCALKKSVYVYAWGYKVDDVDDGTLNEGHDIKLSEKGNNDGKTDPGDYYAYKDKERDSYLYAFISHEIPDSGSTVQSVVVGIAPERAAAESPSRSLVALPSAEQTGDSVNWDSFPDTIREAVFSKELYPQDNMGDINQDGIPDVCVLKYGLGVLDPLTGVLSGDDLKKASGFNDDQDFLPTTDTSVNGALIPQLPETWQTLGTPFNAKTEIRGYHDGLNDAFAAAFPDGTKNPNAIEGVKPERVYEMPDGTYDPTNCTISRLEYLAWKKSGLPADKWSPERPTDPTLADTDEDGFDDGYEYYFWYRAHVGYLENEGTENERHRYLTGRRYNPAKPGEPDTITSDEIAALMDPLVPSGDASGALTRDTDNDGLPDLAEFELGTNPFDFDTDGDGLPDGYEAMLGKENGFDPLLWSTAKSATSDAELNADGDTMAEFINEKMTTVGIAQKDGSVVYYAAEGAGFETALGAEAAGTGTVIRVVNAEGTRTNLYLTTSAVTTNALEGSLILTCNLGKANTWNARVTDGKTVRGASVRLERGTAFEGTVTIEKEQEFFDEIMTAVPDLYWSTWVYGVGGGLALGKENLHHENLKANETILSNRVAVAVKDEQRVRFIHYHAYQQLGFDPRTGWKRPPDNAQCVNTRLFTALDEFLLMAFFHQDGVLDAGELVPSQTNPFTDIWPLYCTDPLKADTDDDGMPDGWELYVMAGPKVYDTEDDSPTKGDRVYEYGPRGVYSPLMPFGDISSATERDNDNDGLEWPNEYSGSASSAEYSETCATIVNLKPEWRNKKWPTDPWNGDTDGDGLKDAEEGTYFIYGDPEATGMAGGGLDPLSWDTDADFLPDPWEVEFAGTAKTTPGSTTATVGANGETNIVTTAARADWNMDGMDGTVDDARLDYDNDGLCNWQEYMTGAVRAWRYDDTVSPWGNLALELDPLGDLITPDPTDAEAWGKFWGDLLVNPLSDTFNPRLVNGRFDGAQAYFSTPTNVFEQAKVKGFVYMFKDGIYHDLQFPTDPRYNVMGTQYNRFTYKPAMGMGKYALFRLDNKPIYPTKYICCDPTNHDSDFDGLDDYYEVFHGLNPLLGERGNDKYSPVQPFDVIYWSYGGDKELPWSAGMNYWVDNPWKEPRTKGLSGDDFEVFPWLAGEAKADPDGDNIRNQQEAIMPNVQAASTYLHTDPTPLWMTDSSYSLSIPRRYYLPGEAAILMFRGGGNKFTYEGVEYKFTDFPWFSYDEETDLVEVTYDFNDEHFGVNGYHFSFEENEGYDSDHDYLSDFEEAQGKTKSASDAQDHDDPLRRQAMYFNGTDAFLQTPLPASETPAEPAAASEPRQNFLYYTVECWAKADAASLAADGVTRVLVERAIVTGTSNPGDEAYLRKNFQLGIRNGLWYTKYDSTGTDKKQAEEITDGPGATTEWTHLAATYDGTTLRLYVNGRCSNEKATKVQPEHGSCAIRVNAAGEITPGQLDYATISILVGAGAKTTQGVIFDALYRGASTEPTTIADYTGFFKGYVDEVTIWDGARPDTDIHADYEKRVRMTRELALNNRQVVYEKWLTGARRSPVSDVQLPAQLMYHWSFDHVAGAILPQDLMKVPAGFDSAYNVVDAKAIWSRPEGWKNPWRASTAAFDPSIRSTVFTDDAWIPWINDTVGHLPRFDKTTLDSVYWSEDFAGATPVGDFGYQKFAFARRAEVYSRWAQQTYDIEHQAYSLTQRTRWDVANSASNDENLAEAYRFALRDKDRTGFDLLPFGGAYPRRISAAEGGMWDDQGASDAWAENGKDSNNNGLPDWWEEYARNNYCEDLDPLQPLEWDTPVSYHGITLRAWQAYLRDLASGMVKEGNKIGIPKDEEGNAIYADTRDVDADGLPDWWEELYGIRGESGLADHDNDGLPNYVEYLLSEVFAFRTIFDPTVSDSVQKGIPDYFYRPAGCQLYVGEIFTDHDRMYDSWEDQYPVGQLSRLIYDAYSDPDGDGWSNVSEMLAGTDPTRTRSLGLEDQVIAEYPVPMIRTRVKIPDNLPESISIVVQGFSKSIDGRPDAIWKTEASEGSFTKKKFVGTNPGGVRRFYLSPGSISPGKVNIAFNDASAVTHTYTVIDGKPVLTKSVITGSGWQNCVSDKLRPDGGIIGDLVMYTGDVVGWINYATGEIEIDFTDAALQVASFVGNTGTAGTGDNAQATEEIMVLDLTQAYVKFSWSAKLVKQGSMSDLYLSDADEGYVREGKNTFIAWADKDGSGTWQPGEPYGIVRDVDVSWSGTTAEIELTDISPVTPRILLTGSSEGSKGAGTKTDEGMEGDPDELDPASDRGRTLSSIIARLRQNLEYEYSGRTETAAYSNALARLEWIDNNRIEATSFAADEFREQRLRVVRWLINGVPAYRAGSNMRTILDKKIRTDLKTSITEADFLVGDESVYDLDWNDLSTEVINNAGVRSACGNVTEVSYLVVIGDGPADWNLLSTNNYAVKALNTVIVRKFGAKQVTPVAVAPGAAKEEIVYSANPTFKWAMNCPEDEGYTAFNVQVLDGTTVIYDSDKQLAPLRNAEGQYEWTAPLYVGDRTMKGAIFENKKSYTWHVAMYNAKYSNAAKYSNSGRFLMQVQTNGYEYGSAKVAVRYFGPKSSYQKGNPVIRVRAYASPDFVGLPVAAGYVAEPDDPANGLTAGTNAAPNCTVIGIPRGTYYLQAFIDSNGNGICDKWETQGYLCTRDGTTPGYLDPTAITFDSKVGKGALAVIYLEDADTDGDGLPDAWEYAEFGSITAKGVEFLDETKAGEFVVNTTLSGALALQEKAQMPTSGIAGEIRNTLVSLSTPNGVSLVTGIDSANIIQTSGGVEVKSEVDSETLTIVDLAVDAANNCVLLKVGAETMGRVDPTVADILNVTVRKGAEVRIRVECANLPNGPWTVVKDADGNEVVGTVTVDSAGAEISVKLDGKLPAQSFFRAVIEE